MAEKETVLRIPGADLEAFKDIFGSYVNTHREGTEGIISDFNGSIDPQGKIYITRKNKDSKERLNYEARLIGEVNITEDGENTELRYTVHPSGAFTVCLIVLGLLSAGFLGTAAYRYFVLDSGGLVLPATFFAAAFVIMLVVSLFKPECRSIEKVLDKIVGEYAARSEKDNPEKENPEEDKAEDTPADPEEN